jgi:hypothetical protein
MNGHPFIPDRARAQVEGGAPATPWFFDSPAAVAKLLRAVEKRKNTPWAENSRACGPGGGYDCENYIEDIALEVGVIDGPFDFPRTDSDFRSHVHNTKFLNYLRGKFVIPSEVEGPRCETIDPRSLRLAQIFAELDIDELVPIARWPDELVRSTGLMPGDLLVIKAHIPGVWHLPMMISDRTFTHCAAPDGVSQGDVTQGDYRSQLRAAFRARAVPLNLSTPQPLNQ